MRSIYPILILFLAPAFAISKNISKENTTLAQARGLQAGHCYQEVAALSCEKECILDFFPTTQAQLSLIAHDISTQDRKKFGRLFNVKFQFLGNGVAHIIKLSSLDIEKTEQKITGSDGYFRKVRCLN